MSNSNNKNRKSVNLLPSYFQTDKNSKFLSGTIDPLYSVPSLTRISGFVGSKLSATYNSLTDVYVNNANVNETDLRSKYQLEPALINQDSLGNIKNSIAFDDLVNQLSFYGSTTNNFNKLFAPDVNSYDPYIDWDKFVNFREYYWLPLGPDPITVYGQQRNTISTYTVTDSSDGSYFIFTPDGLTEDPVLTFYRGVTYVFNVNSKHTFYIKTNNGPGQEGSVTGSGVSQGQIIFTVTDTMPGMLYYASDDINVIPGNILVKNITENSYLDIENDIIGKATYTTASGIEFINGLKINFEGNITPSFYSGKDFIVEGVGDSIKLVDFSTLQTPETISTQFDVNFDATPFDDYPFDNFQNLPLTPEYVTINRSSQDLNPWSRYNRWFHSDVIRTSAAANGIIPDFPVERRAVYPIVEFKSNLQLYNFGTNSISSVDLIDQTNQDVFSTIEGSTSSTVDGLPLQPGQKVIFNADTDPLIRGKVYEVTLSRINGVYKINLVKVIDPVFGNSVVILSGNTGKAVEWWFNGSEWVLSQQRTRLNQAPLFDLFDNNGNSYSDRSYYDSIFSGNKIFGYAIGSGANDPVLGFPLLYKNIGVEGLFLFQNYFNSDIIKLLAPDSVTEIPTSETFLRINNGDLGFKFVNIWTKGSEYQIPVQQFQTVSSGNTVPITVFDNSASIEDLSLEVFINNNKLKSSNYNVIRNKDDLNLQFNKSFNTATNVLINLYTSKNPNETGKYQTPINLTNNPLNGKILQFTFSEISDHVKSMIDRDPRFVGDYPGVSNLKSLPDISKYGSRIITNNNPLAFSQEFIGNIEHSLIPSTRMVGNDYYQFKLNLIKNISNADTNLSISDSLDQVINELNLSKNSSFPYSQSDMVAYGNSNSKQTYTITDSRNTIYPLSIGFSLNSLSFRSVLLYLNEKLLVHGQDYIFNEEYSTVEIISNLTVGDILIIKDYNSTVGNYIPPTPTKLGIYPKYIPSIFIDYSYINPQVVLQGHDGSISIAYTTIDQFNQENYDFRDLLLLEFELRVFNNLKTEYNQELMNIDKILPGIFRQNNYSYQEIYKLVEADFIKWATTFNINYIENVTYDVNEYKSYNYSSSFDYLGNPLSIGGWRGIYKYYFDTDRPDTCPWEMLGFSVMPSWWESEYGPAPYTSGNLNLWEDLEAGLIRQGSRAGIDLTYARPGLTNIIPVDEHGNIVDLRYWNGITIEGSFNNTDQNWNFGDYAPAETAWRRSSLWPFAVQIILALTKPADYAAKMYDPARLSKDITGQYRYGPYNDFLNLKSVYIFSDNDTLTSGYSMMVVERGRKRSSGYLSILKEDLSYVDFNLFYKAGGFLSKDKLEILIDSVSPNSASPGVLLPNENYDLFYNISNPIKSLSISGIIVEKRNAQFVVKGYDKENPYFTVKLPIHKNNDTIVNVGGKSLPYLHWTENTLYQAGQVVEYNNQYYTVNLTTNSGNSFNITEYIKLSQLPIIGGSTAYDTIEFEEENTIIPYGTSFDTIQEVYDIIVGYGQYLIGQGFQFNQYNSELGVILNWKYSAKEFLYWTTQGWANGSIITISPFANQIDLQFTNSVVDNVLNSFYEYSLLTANGQPFPYNDFNISRKDNICSITVQNTNQGLYFAKLNLIQKEHAIILNNTSMFGDIIYDIETGYRQSRIKISGFITGDWNGDYLSPGFVYDEAVISDWQSYKDYTAADVVKYSGKYYSAKTNLPGVATFNFNSWNSLGSKPIARLLPNFDYKISQFEDFYSLDIDNFDAGQQKMAQHLLGYTPRDYLTNIIVDPIAQYKFYQGFIKEKGTANAINKLAKASIHNLQGQLNFKEEWAFRIGSYGNYTTYNEIEFPLKELEFKENSQIIKFVEQSFTKNNDSLSYILPNDLSISPSNYSPNNVFSVVSSCTYLSNNLLLPTAGYVRTDDISATAYNKNSLFDIANNGNLNDGDTIWLGFKSNNDWDVLRYTKQTAKVIESSILNPASSLLFKTNVYHYLSVGDIISITGLDNGTDGVYEVLSIPSLTSFSVATTLSSVSEPTTEALLFKFISVRINEFDNIDDLQSSLSLKFNEKVWADSGEGNSDWAKWAVYQKINNFNPSVEFINGVQSVNQYFGYRLASSDNGDILAVSSPYYYDTNTGYGKVFIYNGLYNQSPTLISTFSLNNPNYRASSNALGKSLIYDKDFNIIIAGAPDANLIQVSDTIGNFVTDFTTGTINTQFGDEIYLTKTFNSLGGKTLYVTSPLESLIYTFNLNVFNTATGISGTLDATGIINATTGTNKYLIAGNIDGSVVLISTPNVQNTSSCVKIYNGTNLIDSIYPVSDLTSNDYWGSAIAVNDDGSYLFISSTSVTDNINGPGKVYVYNKIGGAYQLIQTLHNPLKNQGLNFGTHISVKDNTVYISSNGTQRLNSTIDNGTTIFDNDTTSFYDEIPNSGSVYIFERRNSKFIFARELFDNGTVLNGSNYGASIVISNGSVFVGAPTASPDHGAFYQFSQIVKDSNTWTILRQQDDLVDISKIKRAVTIDSQKSKIIDYLDIFDPVKGKILGIADQELRYKTAFDPAIYSIGTQGVNVDTNTSWIEDHVGELWWDLSTVKYVWYEQSDLEYRKNSWGQLFPGCSIDVYEWVKSEYLPSQWSSLADTIDGLSKNISGQPKYPDNSVISVKQYYDSSTGAATNVYFYWVKNTVVVPNAKNRRISANEVSNLIYNPSSNGTKFVSPLSQNAIAVTNVKNDLDSNNIYLNISSDSINNNINQHTEWVLLSEGDEKYMPTTMLNKKLIDSLVGYDSLGNIIPDPLLSDRQKYGIEIRPRQSMFVDRTEALRNIIEYVNSILSQYRISDIANFTTLNSKEEIPDIYSKTYDLIVDSYDELTSLVTVDKITALLTCQINNGSISNVQIVNSGTSYGNLLPIELDNLGNPITWAGPTVEIIPISGDNLNNAAISTIVNETGNIISASIDNAGTGFSQPPSLVVRPYTVIVRSDINSNNLWAKYQRINNKWVKVHTQDYDTTQYWSYTDWVSEDYDRLKPLAATIDGVWQLNEINISNGSYVKVNNQGNGRYIILEKIESGGNFGEEYNLVRSENATIQLSDNLWNLKNSYYNYDYHFTYDQTLYDQTPITELINILNAIKNDIFVGSLKVYWNYTFFKAVKYAFTEQKFLDWAFKTAFLNVKNLAGSLDQRPVYRFQNSTYYEEYLEEVKPYHSKIRNYQVNYDTSDNSNSYMTDFDLPSYYDQTQQSFINVLDDGKLLNQYPWKSWNDHYTLSVESAVVSYPGSGYTAVPRVEIISADGDTGSGATGEAHISLGKVTSVVITNPGSGYTKTPTILLVGGGSTSLSPAKVYARMSNNKVRRNILEMKFDRITPFNEIDNNTVYDRFIADGNTYEFTLTWPAEHKKSNISVVISNNDIGTRVLASQYDIITTKQLVDGYHRLVSTLVLNSIPTVGQIVSITYNKNINIFNAVGRIGYYYQPTIGMPGNDVSQLMNGIDFPSVQVQGLMFDYTTNWDMSPLGESLYGDDSSYYTTATVSSAALAGTNTLIVSNLTGIYPGLRVNTVSLNTNTTNNNKFNDSSVVVVGIVSTASSVIFSSTITEAIVAGTILLEFWEYNLTPGVLDTILDGGDLGYTTALGINPEDTIVDGESFISPYTSNSPEEMIKGEMYESVGISVYTRTHSGSPLVVHSINQITQTGTSTTFSLPMMPPNDASTMVVFNNSVLTYGYDYSIDFNNNTININTQTSTGVLGITVVGIGGVDLISSDFATVTNSSTISVHVGFADEIGSIYATLNGVQLTSDQYLLSSGKLIVNGISTGTNTLQAWSFSSIHHQFSNVTEEYFIGDGVTTSYQLSVYPGNLGPANAQAIVEIDGKRLISPTTVYYSVSGGQTIFLIDPNTTYPSGTFDSSELEIFVNGIKIRNGIDFYVDQPNNTVVFYPGFLQTGDAMAITNHTFSDYYFDDGYIYIKPTANYGLGNLLKVISFTDGDNSLIRTDTFISRPSNRYNLSRPILSDQYVWVTVENNALINGIDFYLDSTGSVLSIRDTYPYIPGQTISVLSMTNSYLNKGAVGYRVFTDILGRSQFKRISRDNTTRLAEPLYSTSTTIVVENADVLTEPDLVKKIPGSILINGEWIEFLNINHNVLSNLRRSTLGTGAKSVYPAGTSVIDQGIYQNAPYKESTIKQVLTVTNTSSYLINGINLNTGTLNDQFTVLYAGTVLKKDGYYKQDISVSYDTYPYNIIGTVSTATTATFSKSVKLYDSYLVTTTNQMWIYLDSNNISSINGFIYTGLNYVEPDYSINNLTSYGTTGTAILNLNLTNLITGTQITLLQKVAANTMYAATNTSILVDNGLFGVFLRDAPTALPDKYYYGQL